MRPTYRITQLSAPIAAATAAKALLAYTCPGGVIGLIQSELAVTFRQRHAANVPHHPAVGTNRCSHGRESATGVYLPWRSDRLDTVRVGRNLSPAACGQRTASPSCRHQSLQPRPRKRYWRIPALAE